MTHIDKAKELFEQKYHCSQAVLAAFAGLISILIGAADIKDKKEAKKEEQEAAKNQEK